MTSELIQEGIVPDDLIELRSRIFNNVPEGRVITDSQAVIIDVNPAFTAMTGYAPEEIIGKTPNILKSGLQSREFYFDMWRHLSANGHWQGEVWNRKKNGDIYPERLNVFALYDDDDSVSHYVGLLSDLTDNKRQEEQLNMLAHYDVLTQLPNRALFVDRFNQAVAKAERSDEQLALCFLDIDNFKPINDSYGHHIGDLILIEVSRRMTEQIRASDTVSRQGGDEFVILLSDIKSLRQCEETVQRILNAISQPIILDGITHVISASIGVALNSEHKGDVDLLMRHADHAMYQAKQAGRNRYQLYDVEQDLQIEHKHLQLHRIEQAIIDQEFELYYQPKVNMAEGHVFGVEALIRWNHPAKGLLLPMDFLPVISGTSTDISIGQWVIERAVIQLEQWMKIELCPVISINISSHHLLSSSFFEKFKATLDKHPTVDPTYIELEILESSALGDIATIRKVLGKCRKELGVGIALDDFGTGYSSLTHLRALPASCIKVDRSFVRDLLDDPHDYSIIDGVISLADAFSRDVIAEGVESTEHGLALLIMGCIQAQGFGIAKPMRAMDFPKWMQSYIPNGEWVKYGNKQYSVTEKKLKLLKLAALQWHSRFVEYIESSQNELPALPIMNGRECHCGICIKVIDQEDSIATAKVGALQKVHDKVHAIADLVFNYHQQSNHQKEKQGLDELHQAFTDMYSVLDECSLVV